MYSPDIMLLNVQSLNAQTIELLEMDINIYHDIKFLCLTETHSKIDSIKMKQINGFSLSSFFCRNVYEKGGVAIYSKLNLNVHKINLDRYCIDKHFEICAISYKDSCRNSTTIILTCYRSPTGDIKIFLTNIASVLEDLYKPNINIILCGDFNLDSSTHSKHRTDFNCLKNILLTFNLHPVVGWPTRVTINTSTTIDNIFSNILDNSLACVVDNVISDHRTILLELNTENVNSKLQTRQSKRFFSDNSIRDFSLALQMESWSHVYELYTFDDAFDCFYNIFISYFNKYFPLKNFFDSSTRRGQKWITVLT